jgi:hypothetical protein
MSVVDNTWHHLAFVVSGKSEALYFDKAPSNGAWPNLVSGENDSAQGPTSGTKLVSVATTIPTDPFPDAQRLPGFRDWGIDLMMPLSAPSVTFPSDFKYTLTYSAETSAPPYTGVAVNLAGVFNRQGIVVDGTKFNSAGGMDGKGTALSAQSLNRVVNFNGVLLNLSLPQYIHNAAHKVVGATNPQNAVSATGQTIDLPSGTFGTLAFLGTGVQGNQPNNPNVTILAMTLS